MLCSPLKVNRHFKGMCPLHLWDCRVSQARNQHEAGFACWPSSGLVLKTPKNNIINISSSLYRIYTVPRVSISCLKNLTTFYNDFLLASFYFNFFLIKCVYTYILILKSNESMVLCWIWHNSTNRFILALQIICIPSPFVYSSSITWWWPVWTKHVVDGTIKTFVCVIVNPPFLF
jgi:hypothetical protein